MRRWARLLDCPMAFTPHFLDELRTRIGLTDIVGKRVNLKRAGRELTGLCPFHKEKSPSFTLSEEKGFYHCFGCGAHGSVFDFVMQTENLSFPEAVERLAAEAGMEVPVSSPEEREKATRARSLYAVVDAAAAFFEKQLHLPEGRHALEYLRGRDITDETIARFRLGFAPDNRGALKAALDRDGFSFAQQIEAGLLIQPDDPERSSYDRFRGRVMFPIANARGQMIAFGGRILGDGEPKYLNSPETTLFHKGNNLYGLAQARETARDAGTLVVVEGYTDVIAMHQAGLTHAVAPLGTALTEQQIALLWRLTREPILCFDGDSAGERAAVRAAERALPLLKPGYSLGFVALPSGEDPDSLIKSQGAVAMRELIGGAAPLHELLWQSETRAQRLDSPDARAWLEKRLGDHAAKIQDETVRAHYRQSFKDRLWGGRERKQKSAYQPNNRRNSRNNEPAHRLAEKSGAATRIDNSLRREEILLATLIAHPMLFDDVGERLGAMRFAVPELDKLRQEVLITLGGQPSLDFEGLGAHLRHTGFSKLLSGLLSRQVLNHAFYARPETPLEIAREGWLETFGLYQQTQLIAEIQEAERRLADDPSEEAFRMLRALKEAEASGPDQQIDGLAPEVNRKSGNAA